MQKVCLQAPPPPPQVPGDAYYMARLGSPLGDQKASSAQEVKPQTSNLKPCVHLIPLSPLIQLHGREQTMPMKFQTREVAARTPLLHYVAPVASHDCG